MEKLETCKMCEHKKMDFNTGLVCGLTGQKPEFKGDNCPDFLLHSAARPRSKRDKPAEPEEIRDLKTVRENFRKDITAVKPVPAGKRFGNFLLDFLFIQVFSVIVGVIIGLLYSLSGTAPEWLVSETGFGSNILGILLYLIYYLLLEASTGQTIGKMVTGTFVVNLDGEKADFSAVLGRTFSRLIPFEAFSFLGKGVGWHDTIPGTRVVFKNDYLKNQALKKENLSDDSLSASRHFPK